MIQGTTINLGSAKDYIQYSDESNHQESVVVVEADVKIIEASTGKVVWRKVSIGNKSNHLIQYALFKFGTAKINSEMYNSAMNECAENIIKSLIEDLNAGKLFVK